MTRDQVVARFRSMRARGAKVTRLPDEMNRLGFFLPYADNPENGRLCALQAVLVDAGVDMPVADLHLMVPAAERLGIPVSLAFQTMAITFGDEPPFREAVLDAMH